MEEKTAHTPKLQTLTFRSATTRDIPLLNQMIRDGKGYWGYSKEGLDRFIETYAISDTFFSKAFGFIAELDKEVIGHYFFKIDDNPPELAYFFLNTHFIGKGYGRHLWDHCVTEAKKREWKEFTFSSDPYASGFYKHMGAVKINEIPMVTLPGHMAPVMKFYIESALD